MSENSTKRTPEHDVDEIREHDREYANPLPVHLNHHVNGLAVQDRRDMLYHYDSLVSENARLREAIRQISMRANTPDGGKLNMDRMLNEIADIASLAQQEGGV